jgi:hypothetical protein
MQSPRDFYPGIINMKKRGLSLDGTKRRRTSLIVAVVISVMTLAAPASAWSGKTVSVDDGQPSWTNVTQTYTSYGRSWS